MTRQQIEVHYYAVLREARGLSQEVIETAANTPAQLYEDLRAAHGLPLQRELLKVAVNEAFCDWDTPLQARDKVVFIPPVAGG